MKKFLPLIIIVLSFFSFASCQLVLRDTNAHGPARKKEKYDYSLEIVNNSSSKIEYKYEPVITQEGYNSIPYIKIFNSKVYNKIKEMGYRVFVDNTVHVLNVFGTIAKGSKSILYTGIDCGTDDVIKVQMMGHSNWNVDGLPARFVLMIEEDSNYYSLVFDCSANKNSQPVKVIINDEIIEKLKAIKESDFVKGYNGRRRWYGKSVKVQDNLYCFEKFDSGKYSLLDYSRDEENIYSGLYMYDRIHFYYLEGYPENPEYSRGKNLLLLYNEDVQKFFYIHNDPTLHEITY